MKNLIPFLFAWLLAFAPVAHAKDASPAHYIDPASINLKALLPDPPADGSPATLKEIDLILQKQQTRKAADIARAEAEAKLKVFVFADVLGPWFSQKNLPSTEALFNNVTDDAHLATESAKKLWNRPRPPLQDKRIQPAVELENTGSYPSGHSTRGILYALILSSLVPDLKEQLLARGAQIGEDRVIAGVHFPSDVAAGHTLGKALYAQFQASPAFQADLAKAKAEIDAVRPKH